MSESSIEKNKHFINVRAQWEEAKSEVPIPNFVRQARKRTAQEWEQRRYEIARDVMAAMIYNPAIYEKSKTTAQELQVDSRYTLGKWAVNYAEELIHALMMQECDKVPQIKL